MLNHALQCVSMLILTPQLSIFSVACVALFRLEIYIEFECRCATHKSLGSMHMPQHMAERIL